MLTVEKVTTRDAFALLEAPWNELLAASASDTITLTHQWLLAWWDVFHENRDLCILLVRDGESLVGIAPLQKRRTRRFGVLEFCSLEFLASGEDEFDEICSNYLDFIIQKGREAEVLDCLFEYFFDGEVGWDEIVLTDIAGESVNLPLIQKSARARGLSWLRAREQTCIYIPLTTRDAMFKGMSTRYRKRIQRDHRFIKAEASRVRIQKIESEDGFAGGFDALVQLHQSRWESRGEPGSFASEKFMRFHRTVAPRLMQQGWAKLWILWVDDEPRYSIYDFLYGHKIFYYQCAMGEDSELVKSPGYVLREAGIRDAIESGYTECDFLKGKADSYKWGWGGQGRPIIQVRMARRTPKERVYQRLHRMVVHFRPTKRRLQNALQRVKSAAKNATKSGAPEASGEEQTKLDA